jgi:SulP family sulfate permease
MKPKLLTTLVGYTAPQFAADAIAGMTVALVALPLSIAIAIASGAPPAAGLITAVVAGFLISALGGSRVQIGGPTGAFIVVVYDVIAEHGYEGLLLCTLMAGTILVIAGLLRAGRLIRHIPEAVIDGFTIGIAIVIATSQLKDLAGLAPGPLPADFLPKVEGLWAARESLDLAAVGLGGATIGAILVLRRIASRIPGMVLAIAIASAAAAFALPSVDTVGERYGSLPDGLPWPSFPSFALADLAGLLPSALTIALLAGIESLLSAIVADRMIGGAHRSNAELLAQGAANLASPLFGGLPATGAIARTATNVRAGGRTPVAGIVHALAILVAMIFVSSAAEALALPALAGLLIVTAWSMTEPHRWPDRLALPRSELALMLLTIALTVLADLTVAIGVGTGIGLALRLSVREPDPPTWQTPERGQAPLDQAGIEKHPTSDSSPDVPSVDTSKTR